MEGSSLEEKKRENAPRKRKRRDSLSIFLLEGEEMFSSI